MNAHINSEPERFVPPWIICIKESFICVTALTKISRKLANKEGEEGSFGTEKERKLQAMRSAF